MRGNQTPAVGFGLIVLVFGGLLVYGIANKMAERPPNPILRPMRQGDTWVYESFAPNPGVITATVVSVSPKAGGSVSDVRFDFDRHVPGERVWAPGETSGKPAADRTERLTTTHRFFQSADGSVAWRGVVSGQALPGLTFLSNLRSPLAVGDGDVAGGMTYRVSNARRIRADRRHLMAYPVEVSAAARNTATIEPWTDWYAEHPLPICRVEGAPGGRFGAGLPTFRLYEFKPGQ